MSEATHPPADSVGTPEVRPVAPVSPMDTRHTPIIELIRRKLGAAAQGGELGLAPTQLPDEEPERRGVITGRTHDQVVQDMLSMHERRLRQRRRAAAHILGPRAVLGRYN